MTPAVKKALVISSRAAEGHWNVIDMLKTTLRETARMGVGGWLSVGNAQEHAQIERFLTRAKDCPAYLDPVHLGWWFTGTVKGRRWRLLLHPCREKIE